MSVKNILYVLYWYYYHLFSSSRFPTSEFRYDFVPYAWDQFLLTGQWLPDASQTPVNTTMIFLYLFLLPMAAATAVERESSSTEPKCDKREFTAHFSLNQNRHRVWKNTQTHTWICALVWMCAYAYFYVEAMYDIYVVVHNFHCVTILFRNHQGPGAVSDKTCYRNNYESHITYSLIYQTLLNFDWRPRQQCAQGACQITVIT